MNAHKIQAWVDAARPRTLPLTLSTILLGGFLAYSHGYIRWDIFSLAMLTALFLQILSNLANDYGDSSHKVDNEKRVGPQRTVQSGRISKKEMKVAIWLFSLLALLTGVPLVIAGTQSLTNLSTLIFLLLGGLAIIAAIRYTVGKHPYGYSGFGDLFVFLFFGLASVKGTYILITQHWNPQILLPASAMGFLSVAVLNLNNMRDRENDAHSGKHTIVVKIGIRLAKLYHLLLIICSIAFGLIYMLMNYHSPFQMLFLITIPIFWMHVYAVYRNTIPEQLDPYLKKLALTSLLFSVSFGLGLIL